MKTKSRIVTISRGSWVTGMFLLGAGLGTLISGAKNTPSYSLPTPAFDAALRLAEKTGDMVVVQNGTYKVMKNV